MSDYWQIECPDFIRGGFSEETTKALFEKYKEEYDDVTLVHVNPEWFSTREIYHKKEKDKMLIEKIYGIYFRIEEIDNPSNIICSNEYVVNNLDTAYTIFKSYKNISRTYADCQNKKFKGHGTIIVTKIDENGLISYPFGEKPIDRFEF
jgi:uncharacterized phage-like protein YoqJ